MFCRICGEEINDKAIICPKCGCETGIKIEKTPTVIDKSKTGMGILLCLVLGIIGLVIGILLYKDGTVARKTFIKSWTITFVISIAIGVLLFIISMVYLNNSINELYNGYY